MKADKKVVSFDDFSSDVDVKLSVKLSPQLNKLKKADLINALSLQKSHSFEKGMVGLDSTGKVKAYDSLLDILKEYFEVRQDLYVKRYRELKRQKEAQRDFRVNQVNFIEALTRQGFRSLPYFLTKLYSINTMIRKLAAETKLLC